MAAMKLQIRQKIIGSYSWRRLFYTLCFMMFCLSDQRIKTGSGLDNVIVDFQDASGIVLACIIFAHYKWADYVKWKWIYLGWCVFSLLGVIGKFPYFNGRIVILVNVVMWGYIVLHTFIKVVLEREYPKLNRKMLITWGIMMLLMIVSRSVRIWPLCYLIMFGCFYLTPFTKEEQEDLWQGCWDGIFLAFILFQGFCCVFRPYDDVRYVGLYNNPNLNALYYLSVLAAVLSKALYLTKQNAHKLVRAFYWLAAGTVLSFLFMTMTRSAWIVAFLMGLLFLGFWNVICRKKRFLRNGMLLVLCFVLMFPISFGATRYLPPAFHHPIWFYAEWSEDKVHSWDPWNSEKFVDMDEFLDAALGRIAYSVKNLMEHSPFYMKADAAEVIPDDDPRALAEVLSEEEGKDGFLVRSTIYKYYFTHLNWRGHPYSEQGFQLNRYAWIGHAHNIFLQYGTDFGIPVMLLFAALILWGGMICGRRGRRNASIIDMAALFYLLVPAVFGLFEYGGDVGCLNIVMMFIAWSQAMKADEEAQIA